MSKLKLEEIVQMDKHELIHAYVDLKISIDELKEEKDYYYNSYIDSQKILIENKIIERPKWLNGLNIKLD